MTSGLILELLLKSGVIAGAGLLLSATLAFRPATDRVDILRATVCLLVALPLFLILGPRIALPLLAASEAGPVMASVIDLPPVAGLAVSADVAAPPWEILAVLAYAAGLTVMLGRFLLGVWTLRRWTRDGRAVADPAWTEPLKRLDATGRTRLVVSTRVEAPLSWGPPPGIVLIGDDCLKRPQTARAVLAHEMAHVRRGDWLFLALSRVALAVFWFNPLVWWLHATLVARTEDAADTAALAEVDRQTYAHALVGLAAGFSQPAALGMAGDYKTLTRRISRIMKPEHKSPSRPAVLALAVGALIAVATPLAALEVTHRAASSQWSAPPPPPAAPRAPQAPEAPPPPPPRAMRESPPPPPPPPAPPAPAEWTAPPAPPASPAPPAAAQYAPGVAYFVQAEDTPENRRAVREARAEAGRARVEAGRARAEAARAVVEARAQIAARRVDAEAVRVQARAASADAAQARVQAQVAREQAMRETASTRVQARAASVQAAQARVQAAAAQEQAARAMVDARIQMGHGAEQMTRGADQMREEAVRLRDPAYRARQIEENRARGNVVTDQELIDLSRSLPGQADELDRNARRMREQASRGS